MDILHLLRSRKIPAIQRHWIVVDRFYEVLVVVCCRVLVVDDATMLMDHMTSVTRLVRSMKTGSRAHYISVINHHATMYKLHILFNATTIPPS